MNTHKNISFFIIATLLFSLDSTAMTRLGSKTASKAIRSTPSYTKVSQPRRFFTWVSNKLTRTRNWFNRSNTPQPRYFSSNNVSNNNSVELFKALQSGSKETLLDLIKRGLIDINARYEDDETILHIAVKNDVSSEIIELLIDAGVNIHAKDTYGYTALHSAVEKDNVTAVKLLVAKGANPNSTTTKNELKQSKTSSKKPKGKSPLYFAQEKDSPSKETLEIIEFLKPLTDRSLWFVITPKIALHRAVLHNQSTTVKDLLAKHKFNKNTLNTELLEGSSYIFSFYDNRAVKDKIRTEILAMLINAGADVNTQDSIKRTPLHEAAKYTNLEAVKLLIAKGANPNALEYKNKTPLDLARENSRSERNMEIIKILEPLTTRKTKSGASSAVDKLLLLRKAINANEAYTVKMILNTYTFSKNELNDALLEASSGGFEVRAEMLTALIEKGADVNTRDDYQRTPLHKAVIYTNPASVAALLKKGANPNLLDNNGKSPIYRAQEEDIPSQEELAIIKLLEPVTKRSLWFVVTDAIRLRRAVKIGSKEDVQDVLEGEVQQEKPRYDTNSAKYQSSKQQEKKKTAKEFKLGNKEELVTAWNQTLQKKPVYEILNLNKDSSDKEINTAFRNWAKNHHPDRYKDTTLKNYATKVFQYLTEHLRQK